MTTPDTFAARQHALPRWEAIDAQQVLFHPLPIIACGTLLALLCIAIRIRVVSALLRKGKSRHPFPHLAEFLPTPTLPAHPILGHASQMGADFTNPTRGTRRLVTENTNPRGMSSMWLVGRPTLVVLHHEDARAVLMSSSYRKDLLAPFSRHFNMFLGRKSLLLLMGREWRTHRSRIHRAFVPASVKDFQPALERVGRELVASLRSRMRTIGWPTGGAGPSGLVGIGDGGVTIDMAPITKMATMDAFGLTAIGRDFACRTTLQPSPIVQAFDYLSREHTRRLFRDTDSLAAQCYWIPTRENLEHKRQRRVLTDFLRGIIKERREEVLNSNSGLPRRRRTSFVEKGEKLQRTNLLSGRDDLLTMMIRADYEERKAKGSASPEGTDDELSDEVLIDTVRTLLFAGYDTTSTTLTYALYLVAKHPEVEERIIEEINNSPLASSCNSSDGPEAIQAALNNPEVDLPYTTAVITETLRLYSPAPQVNRALERDTTIGGIKFAKGTNVFIPFFFIHRDERNFVRPDEFLPERWVRQEANENGGGIKWMNRHPNDPKEAQAAAQQAAQQVGSATTSIPPGNRDALFPFSGGARSCVGKRFAMQESVTMLAILLQSYKFEVPRDYVLKPVQAGPVQKPKDGMPLIVRERRLR